MLNKCLKIKVLIEVTLYMLNTIKNALVDQNLLLVVQPCCGHDEFVVESGTLSTTHSCSKTYDCNMFSIQQYSNDILTVVAVLGIPLVDIVESILAQEFFEAAAVVVRILLAVVHY